MTLFAELRRRNVFKLALLYVVAAWVLLWLESVASAQVGLPAWTREFLYLIIAIGFPVAVIFAYVYEITPSGLKKAIEVDQTQSIVYKTGQKLNAAVFVLAVLGVVFLIFERMLPELKIPPEERLIATTSEVEGVPAEIGSITLENGVRIIIWPNGDGPDIVMRNIVRVGSRNEYVGITGISTLLQRMLAADVPGRLPGEHRALTTKDLTIFESRFAVEDLNTVIELAAARIDDLEVTPEALEVAWRTLKSDAMAGAGDDARRLLDHVTAVTFLSHPYRLPIQGWPSEIGHWTVDTLKAFHRDYYAPRNQTIVFTGAVPTDELLDLARDHLGSISDRPTAQPVATVEPGQRGKRLIILESDSGTPLLAMAFRSGRGADGGALGRRLLLDVLADDETSRLHQALMGDEPLVDSIESSHHEGFDPGITWLLFRLPHDTDPAVVESRVLDEIARLITEGIDEEELAGARSRMLARFEEALSTPDGKAMLLGAFDVFQGSFENFFSLPERLEAVTSADLQAVAAEVFSVSNMTVGRLHAPPPPTEHATDE
jgi:zinc protease